MPGCPNTLKRVHQTHWHQKSDRLTSKTVMNFQTEIETLIRARYPILYVISSEEMRVQNLIVDLAAKRQKKVFEWTFSNGIVPAGTSIQSNTQS